MVEHLWTLIVEVSIICRVRIVKFQVACSVVVLVVMFALTLRLAGVSRLMFLLFVELRVCVPLLRQVSYPGSSLPFIHHCREHARCGCCPNWGMPQLGQQFKALDDVITSSKGNGGVKPIGVDVARVVST